MKIKIKKLRDDITVPYKAYDTDAGFDLSTPKNMPDVAIHAHHSVVIPLGFAIEIPYGFFADIRPRSSIFKAGLLIEGTIDPSYRGEVGLMIHNNTDTIFILEGAQRLAQMVILPIPDVVIEETDTLSSTTRGTGGFGSTGSHA